MTSMTAEPFRKPNPSTTIIFLLAETALTAGASSGAMVLVSALLASQPILKVRAESDPEVLKGLDLLPQAKALADNAKKIVAEHNSAGAFNR